MGGNWTMVCYLLNGGAFFAELWTLSSGHGYAWVFENSWICWLIFPQLSHFLRESPNTSYLWQTPVPYLAWPLIRRKGARGKTEKIAINSKKSQFFCLYSREINFKEYIFPVFFTSGFLSFWFCKHHFFASSCFHLYYLVKMSQLVRTKIRILIQMV